jgi:hypothetical protein
MTPASALASLRSANASAAATFYASPFARSSSLSVAAAPGVGISLADVGPEADSVDEDCKDVEDNRQGFLRTQ